ncbi:MAG TPA: TIGR03618 family F420-dependent PPOX class oxidoreductase [Acidimicrobiia bacterium]
MLNDKAVALATGPNLGMISTVMPNGHIQTQPVWVDSDGEHVLVNTEIHRQKMKNLKKHPMVTVTIMDHDNHWNWVEVRGKLVDTITGTEARSHIDKLAKKYMGVDDYPNPIQSERVILVIEPDRVFSFPPA